MTSTTPTRPSSDARILKAFRSSGAVAPERAKTLERLGLKDRRYVRQLRNRDIICEVNAGEYYLDEDALREYQSAQFKWMAVPLALVLILMIYAMAKG